MPIHLLPPWCRSFCSASRLNIFRSRSSRAGELAAEERRAYEDRLEFEIGVINTMGFGGYFLIVADFINYVKTAAPNMAGSDGVEIRWKCDPSLLNPGDLTPPEAKLHFPGGLKDFLAERIDGLTDCAHSFNPANATDPPVPE